MLNDEDSRTLLDNQLIYARLEHERSLLFHEERMKVLTAIHDNVLWLANLAENAIRSWQR